MKRNTIFPLILATLILMFCGCRKLPESGPYGTIDTATAAAEYNDVLYFLHNVGPVFDPVNIAAYDLASRELYEAISIPELAIMGFQIYEDVAYCLTSKAVYACGLDGSEQRVLAETDEEGMYRNAWFFRLEDTLYICRSTFGAEKAAEEPVRTQIIALSTKDGGYETIAELEENLTFWYSSAVAYWDGKLYARTAAGEHIYTLSLEDGKYEDLGVITNSAVMAMEDGIYYQLNGNNGTVQQLSGDGFLGEAPKGYVIGSNGDALYYLTTEIGVYSSVYCLSEEAGEVISPSYDRDMVTDIKGYVAGDYVLFYTSEDLTGNAETDNWLHYIYLIDGEEIKKIGSYTQDSPYV